MGSLSSEPHKSRFGSNSLSSVAKEYGSAIVIDVETTGLDASRHEILELAMILFRFDRMSGQVLGKYVGLQEPSREIPSGATAIHGISYDMVEGRALNSHRIRQLFGKAEFIVAHNARFDHSFVTQLYPETANMIWLCSMLQINWKSYGYPSRALQSLLITHRLSVKESHRAYYDCQGVLLLLDSKNPRGERYFKELLGRLPYRKREAYL